MLRPAAILAAVAALAAATFAWAATPRDNLLVTSDWLAQHLNDPNIIIIHAGTQADYTAGHIPGARLALQDGLSASPADSGGLTLQLPTSGDLQFKMTQMGISDNSRIVVYANRQMEAATRLILALDAAGFGDKTSLLDGGIADWRRTNHQTSTETPAVKEGRIAGFRLKDNVVTVDTLRNRMGKAGTVVIDARAQVFYDGVQAGMATTKRGHIPGAKSLPYTSVTGSDGKLKSEADLRALFTAAGVKTGDKIIVYCHVGQQATAVIFAARTLGIEAQLYDGSFQDWSAHDYPVEGPPAPAAG